MGDRKDMEMTTRVRPPVQQLETTVGDLICALVEAAREASVDEQDIARLTQVMLNDLVKPQ